MPSAPLLLIGASGLAAEAAECARRSGIQVLGCLDDDASIHGQSRGGLRVLGGLDVATTEPDSTVLLCTGRGATRRLMADRLAVAGVDASRWATLVDPSVIVPTGTALGAGSILLAGVVITAPITIGAHVVVMPNVTLTHDDVIQDFVTLAAGVALGGGVRVGAGAYVGMNASVRQQLVVGRGAVLGMGSVLLRDLPEGAVWAGVPAGPLRSD